jgi:hypothetical protein
MEDANKPAEVSNFSLKCEDFTWKSVDFSEESDDSALNSKEIRI